MSPATSCSVCHRTAEPSVFAQRDLCVLFIINVLGLFFKTGVFSRRDGNQALFLQWESSPAAAVWGSGLYTANNQIYPSNSIPVALR